MTISRSIALASAVCAALSTSTLLAGNAAEPAGDPVMERPTLLCLGTHWIIKGDDNKNATIRVQYMKAGESDKSSWREGPPLFRVEKGKEKPKESKVFLEVPEDATLYAGSVVLLEPDTAYSVKLTLNDPDGGSVEKILSGHTRAEPKLPDGPVVHVIPGEGDGDGTAANPVRGIKAALEWAKPGTTLLLHKGVYEGEVMINKSGEPGKPIVLKAAGDGEVILDGKGKSDKPAPRGIDVSNVHDVWFYGLTIRNAHHAIVASESERLVVQRCHMHDVDFGVTATRNQTDKVNDFFISDNVIEGPSVWPRSKGIEDARGVQIAGAGHVVCYNLVRGFGDAIDTYQNGRCEDIDFHNNDVYELTDDGFEMDYSQRNTRCFYNRMTNVHQGLSVQPVYGGPVYLFRNVMYNVQAEPYKMHNSPSGTIFYNNTVVKEGWAVGVMTSAPMSHNVWRNNLYIGTAAPFGMLMDVATEDCDFDYCGFGGGPFEVFLKWNRVRYSTIEEAREKAPIMKHAVSVDAAKAFASGVTAPSDFKVQVKTPPDLRLSATSEAVDSGEVLPGFTDGFAGKAPDLGAYEVGAPVPHYGPRALK